ncbi:hypothetical protein ACFQ0D_11205 [Micromonospora zhanjiangensis]
MADAPPATTLRCRRGRTERDRLEWRISDGGDPAGLIEEFLAGHGLPVADLTRPADAEHHDTDGGVCGAALFVSAAAGNLLAALEDAGYEPRRPEHDGGAVVLGNCPFHRLAQQYTALVCGVNLHLLRGVADGAGDSRCIAELVPGPGHCCVRLRPGSAVKRPDP